MKRKRPDPEGPPPPSRFAYEGLDRVLHEKARLGILVSLSARADGLIPALRFRDRTLAAFYRRSCPPLVPASLAQSWRRLSPAPPH